MKRKIKNIIHQFNEKKKIYQVSRKRSFLKTVTWRIIASLDTFIIVWVVTGQISWAGSVAGLEILTKTFLYYLHERGWNYILWGKYSVTRKKLLSFQKLFF